MHGDIKPDNMLVNDSQEAAICDFGLARIIQEMQTGFTTTAQGQGGKGYLDPELLDCEEKKTTHSDVYRFGGLVLYVRAAPPMSPPGTRLLYLTALPILYTGSECEHPILPCQQFKTNA